jgi:hypothetical protein
MDQLGASELRFVNNQVAVYELIGDEHCSVIRLVMHARCDPASCLSR